MTRALHLKITGRVQGVFFRSTTKEKADSLGLTGWVKNCDDGSVEVFAQGEDQELREFVGWCGRGPEGARVDKVRSKKTSNDDNIKDFRISA